MLKVWSVRTSAGAGRDALQWKPRVRGRWQNYYYHHHCHHLEPDQVEEDSQKHDDNKREFLEEAPPNKMAFLPEPIYPGTSCLDPQESLNLDDPFCGESILSSKSSLSAAPSSSSSSSSSSSLLSSQSSGSSTSLSSSSSSQLPTHIQPENDDDDTFEDHSQISPTESSLESVKKWEENNPPLLAKKDAQIHQEYHLQSEHSHGDKYSESLSRTYLHEVTCSAQDCCATIVSTDSMLRNDSEEVGQKKKTNQYLEFHDSEFNTQECWTMVESAIREDALRRCRPYWRKSQQSLPILQALQSWNSSNNQRFFRAVQLELDLGLNVDREGVLDRIMNVSFQDEKEQKLEEGWNLLVDYLLSQYCPVGYVEFLTVVNQAMEFQKTQSTAATRSEGMLQVIQTLDDLCSSNVFWEGENREIILDSLFITLQHQRHKKKRAPTARDILGELKLIENEMNNILASRTSSSKPGEQQNDGGAQCFEERKDNHKDGGKERVPIINQPTNQYHHTTTQQASAQTCSSEAGSARPQRPPLGTLDGNLKGRRGKKQCE